MRKARKPRSQYVYAAGPARWIADAFTMNRTIATKMIVMSIELSTRGSMPGAIRSEIIARSSARAAIHHLPPSRMRDEALEASKNVVLEARVAQEPRQQLGAHRDRRKVDVLVGCVRASSLGAEAVEDRDAERADQVSVRPAARGLLLEVEAELAAVIPRPREERRCALGALEGRTRPATADCERHFRMDGLDVGERALDALTVGGAGHADVDPCLGFGRDDVLRRAAADDADVDRCAARLVVERVQRVDLMRELVNRAHTFRPVRSGVRRPALDGERE